MEMVGLISLFIGTEAHGTLCSRLAQAQRVRPLAHSYPKSLTWAYPSRAMSA